MRPVKSYPLWVKTLAVALPFISLPVGALVFMDSRHVTVQENEWSEGKLNDKLIEVEAAVDDVEAAVGSVEKIMMEKRVDETKDQCDTEPDPMRKATYCERYRQYKSQLCSKYPDSWLC